jgi:hypothetical protein
MPDSIRSIVFGDLRLSIEVGSFFVKMAALDYDIVDSWRGGWDTPVDTQIVRIHKGEMIPVSMLNVSFGYQQGSDEDKDKAELTDLLTTTR